MVTKHFQEHDIQLSVASMSWFLTLFINSMPMMHALRVLDWFFVDGPRVLFQLALTIIKLNGEAILAVTDDGELMNIFKDYFATLDDPVDTGVVSAGGRQITKFNQLIVIAGREFGSVSTEMIISLRKSH